MSITIEEVLENAEYNISNAVMPFQKELGNRQLKNYNIAKKLGANNEDDWDDWEEKVEEYKNK